MVSRAEDVDYIGGLKKGGVDVATVADIAAVPSAGNLDSGTELPSSAAVGKMFLLLSSEPSALTLGPVVYTASEIASWSTGAAYTALAASWGGNSSRTIEDMGATIADSGDRSTVNDNAVYACSQAILWAVDNDPARLAKVVEVLDSVKDVSTYDFSPGQNGLWAGWFASTLCRAAAIIGRANYDDASFDNFLRNVLYNQLDWYTAFNWHAVHTDARTSIASYLGDEALWSDSKSFGEYRIGQGIFLSSLDGSTVTPVPNALWPTTSPANLAVTQQHWGSTWGSATEQIDNGYAFKGVWTQADGATGERSRDLGHVTSGMISYTHAARTAEAVGDPFSTEAQARLVAGITLLAERVLHYIDNATLLAPGGLEGSPTGVGGTNHEAGWFNMKAWLDDIGETVADVNTLVGRSDVINASVPGANQTSGERVADQ